MKMVSISKIRQALSEEYKAIEPSENIWTNVAAALPPSPDRGIAKKGLYKAAIVTFILAISTLTFVAAQTDVGKDILENIYRSFGIHILENTPQVQAELKQQGVEPKLYSGVALQGNEDKLPSNIKLPSYMTEDLNKASIYIITAYRDVMIRWSDETKSNEHWVMISYHEEAFGEGSKTISSGEVTELKEVKIGSLDGFSFKDDNGWNISWAMDGHQYEVLTDISLEEGLRVAASIQQ